MYSREALNKLSEYIGRLGGGETQEWEDIILNDLEVLEKYKKIEEELGIDLITLFKFFKKEMVFKYGDDGRYIYHAYPSFNEFALVRVRGGKGWALKFWDDYYYLKDFNKTFRISTKTAIGKYWALKNGGKEF